MDGLTNALAPNLGGQDPVAGWAGFPTKATLNQGDQNRLIAQGALKKKNAMTSQEKWGAGLGAAQLGMNLAFGLEDRSMARKEFNFQKQAYETNLANNRLSINQQQEDQWKRDNAYTGGNSGTLDEHMTKWGAA